MNSGAHLFVAPTEDKRPLGDLPESRRTHHRPTICGPLGIMAQVYCVNCGRDGGLVTEEWAEQVFYLCDKCAERKGMPGQTEVPDEAVRNKMPRQYFGNR